MSSRQTKKSKDISPKDSEEPPSKSKRSTSKFKPNSSNPLEIPAESSSSISEDEDNDLLTDSTSSSKSNDESPETSVAPMENGHSSTTSTNTVQAPVKNEKLSWFQKKKKGIASKTATSSLGSAMIKKYVDKDSQLFIKSICSVIEKEDGVKEAKKVRKAILKAAVKIFLLIEDKKVTNETFTSLESSFRRICSAFRNAYMAKSLPESTAVRIHSAGLVFYNLLENSLSGLLSSKTLSSIKELIDLLLSIRILTSVTKYPTEFQQIAYVLNNILSQQ